MSFTLTLPNKGLFLITGNNGTGKTTLLYILAGLDTHYTGSVTVDGKELKKMKEKERARYRREKVSLLLPRGNLLPLLSVEESLSLGVKKGREVKSPINISLKESSFSLSGGEEILIALAYEIAKEKKIYLFDEVFDALDSNHRKELSKTSLVLLVSHVIRLFFRKQKEYRSLRNGRGSDY